MVEGGLSSVKEGSRGRRRSKADFQSSHMIFMEFPSLAAICENSQGSNCIPKQRNKQKNMCLSRTKLML